MPKPRGFLSSQIDFAFLVIDDAPAMPESEPAVELPDQAARQVGEQGVVEITVLERFDGDGALGEQEALDARAVRQEHLLHVLHGALQVLPLIGVMFFYVGWNAFQ